MWFPDFDQRRVNALETSKMVNRIKRFNSLLTATIKC